MFSILSSTFRFVTRDDVRQSLTYAQVHQLPRHPCAAAVKSRRVTERGVVRETGHELEPNVLAVLTRIEHNTCLVNWYCESIADCFVIVQVPFLYCLLCVLWGNLKL